MKIRFLIESLNSTTTLFAVNTGKKLNEDEKSAMFMYMFDVAMTAQWDFGAELLDDPVYVENPDNCIIFYIIAKFNNPVDKGMFEFTFLEGFLS